MKTKKNAHKIAFDVNKKKAGIILPYKEFVKLMEELEDLQDLYIAHKRTAKAYKTIPFEQVKKELFSDDLHK